MAKRICIGNLPPQTDESKVESLLKPYGTASDILIISTQMGGQQDTLAYAVMDHETEAQGAVSGLNGYFDTDRYLSAYELPGEPTKGIK